MSLIRSSFLKLFGKNTVQLRSTQVSSQIINFNRNLHRYVAPTLRELKARRAKMGPEPIKPRSSFIEWNYSAELFAFAKRLHEEIDSKLLQQVFTHRSYIIKEEYRQQQVGITEPITNLDDNENLVEHGHELLNKYITDLLVVHLPKYPTIGINKIKDYLLSDKSLANISQHIGTKDLILSADFPVEEITLSKTFKAVVGAIGISSGNSKVFEFIRDFVFTQLNGMDINEIWDMEQPIQFLENISKELNLGEPEPRLIGDAAKNTILSTFSVGIYCNKKLMGTGFGETITIAIDVAARNSLYKIFETDRLQPLNFKIPHVDCLQKLKNNTKMTN